MIAERHGFPSHVNVHDFDIVLLLAFRQHIGIFLAPYTGRIFLWRHFEQRLRPAEDRHETIERNFWERRFRRRRYNDHFLRLQTKDIARGNGRVRTRVTCLGKHAATKSSHGINRAL